MDGSAEATVKALEKLRAGEAWNRIERDFYVHGTAVEVQKGLTEATDAIAIEAYREAIEPVLQQGAAMLALGSFGRQELFPYSDVDVLILLEADSPWVALREVLAEFVRLLWDAGLRLNHTVRTLDECVGSQEQNLDFGISLLDRRFLAGDSGLHQELESRLPAFFAKQGPKLSQHLTQSARLRHSKYQNTFRHRQPDVKETPGGLRDLHLIGHLAQLSGQSGHRSEELQKSGQFISAVRCALHYSAQGDRNLLDFEAQENLAGQPFVEGGNASGWMKEYFERAGLIFKEARRALEGSEKSQSSLLDNFRDWRARLSNSEFTVSREHILLRDPAQAESDPSVLFRLLEFIGRHNLRVSAETERRMASSRVAFAEYCARPQAIWGSLESILSQPHVTAALRALDDAGLLSAMLPEWTTIENLVVTEPEHRYTIDEHTLLAIERAVDLRSTRDPGRQRFSQLLSEIDHPAILLFAILFHAMGKSSGQGNRLEQAVARAREAMARVHMPAEEQSTVEFLILRQMDLSEVMTGEIWTIRPRSVRWQSVWAPLSA